MYGKIYTTIYEGTLYGHWEAIVTMQQLIVLASPDGIVDMTPQALAARTSIPLKIIEKGLKVLSDPDPHSRTPGDDGRRIALLDDHRPWGWRLVNHEKYVHLRSVEQKREADRLRISEKRIKNKNVAISREVSQSVANVAHLDTDTDIDINKEQLLASSGKPLSAVELIPLIGKREWPVSKAFLEELEAAYPQVDGPATLREIRAWCISNPTKCKTERGVMRFINRWFERVQNA